MVELDDSNSRKRVLIWNRIEEASMRDKLINSADPTEKVFFEGVEYSLYELRGLINQNQKEQEQSTFSFGPGFNENFLHYPNPSKEMPTKDTGSEIKSKKNHVLNINAAKRFANNIENVNPNNIWKQQDIGCGMVLYGFYSFNVKLQKDGSFTVTLKTASKSNIKDYINQSGFRKVYLKDSRSYLLVKVVDNVIQEVSADIIRVQCYNEAKKYGQIVINVGEGVFVFEWKLLDTIYLQYQDQIFNRNFLELLEEFKVPQLKDTRTQSYFLFKNTIIKVEKSSIELLPYSSLAGMDRCVWKSHIINRNYNESDSYLQSEYEKFIINVSNNQENRISAFKSALGYLMHHYNGSHMGQAVVCYDEQPTDVKNPQGGTGKGLFAQGIANMREAAKLDGKHFKSDDRFRFQSVNITSQLVIIDDLNKEVSFDTFFSAVTDGFTIEKKNQDSIKLDPEDSPKMLFSMNSIIANTGTSYTRRLFVIEFSNFYSRHIINGSEKPIEDTHGVLFDRIEWKDEHWSSFTKYMIGCVQFYLMNGLQPYELINVGKNSLIQQTSEEFSIWCEEKQFQTNTSYRTKELYEEYKNCYFGENGDFAQRSFTNMMKKFASVKSWKMEIYQDSYTKTSDFMFKEKVNSEENAF